MDVIVIGAGLAGLTAAAVLQSSGAQVHVLEASAYVGGRIDAFRDLRTGKALADLGPTWVWPKYQPVVAEWLERLRVQTFAQYDAGDAVVHGHGPAPIRQPLPGQDGIMRIVGGPTALVDALAERVGSDKLSLSSAVVEISEAKAGRVKVHLASGDSIIAQQVIVAIPLRVLANTVRLSWAPRSLIEVMRETPTWMSTHAKAVALYERAFWREVGLSGRIASRKGPLVEAHDHSGVNGTPAAIFGFVGWPAELRLKDPAGLKQAILRQLTDCFGPEASEPASLVVRDWATRPFVASSIDLSQPPAHPGVAPSSLRKAYLDGSVRFAVSETSEVSPGLIEGALATGARAASDVLSATV